MGSKVCKPLVRDPDDVKLAMVGKVTDDDHPYSWSAILNGTISQALKKCPNPIIRKYLSAQPKRAFGISGVCVTHIWCDDAEDARRVAHVGMIPNVVSHPEGVLGSVDAVLIPTDKGEEHLESARPFVEAGLPVFIDKPLTLCEDHLRQFVCRERAGKPIMSSSCMRYAREFLASRKHIDKVGELRLLTFTTCRSWERCGIHAMEAGALFGSPHGCVSVTHSGTERAAIVHVRHRSGVDFVIAAIEDMDGSFGHLSLYGTKGILTARFGDSFFAFKAQLAAFVNYLRMGTPSYTFDETVQLIKVIIAGVRSRDKGGRVVEVGEIASEPQQKGNGDF